MLRYYTNSLIWEIEHVTRLSLYTIRGYYDLEGVGNNSL
jgi:hypothetical protein